MYREGRGRSRGEGYGRLLSATEGARQHRTHQRGVLVLRKQVTQQRKWESRESTSHPTCALLMWCVTLLSPSLRTNHLPESIVLKDQ